MKHGRCLLLSCLAAGCAVEASPLPAGSSAVNQCEEHAECGEGRCVSGECRAREGTLSSVLFEVAVPGTSSAARFAGARYLIQRDDVPLEGGRLDLGLPDVFQPEVIVSPPPCVAVEGGAEVARSEGICPDGSTAPAGTPEDCRYVFDQTIEVVFTPKERFLGVPTVPVTVTATCRDGDCGLGQIAVRLAPGAYDVYVRPSAAVLPSDACPFVPRVFDIEVADDSGVRFNLVAPSVFAGSIEYSLDNPEGELAGWTLELLDPVTARRISTVATLEPPTLAEAQIYPFEIAYLPMPDAGGTLGNELLRLKPPAGAVAPTLIMERSALEVFPGEVSIRHVTALPEKVVVEGHLLVAPDPDEPDDFRPISGTVTFIATTVALGLSELPLPLASFRTTTEADQDGLFSAELLPGSYRVIAVPPASCAAVDVVDRCDDLVCECPFAATEVHDWDVSAQSFQGGKTVELVRKSLLEGSVETAFGRKIAGAEVLAVPIPIADNALASELGREKFIPRSASARVDERGRYRLLVDPGIFDISVRPEGTTRYPWLVHPAVDLSDASTEQTLDLWMPLPVAYSGEISVPGDLILPEAMVRAFVRRTEEDPASGLIQVGQAISNEHGIFELILPAQREALSP